MHSYTPSASEIVRQAPVESPDVSVVIAVKDGERFLEKSVRSIFGQTLSNLELIVVDDGSTDRTPEILDRFGDARMKIVTQPNRGLAASLNRGVSLARAEFVARMDADDIAFPERLQAQLEFMNANPEVGVVGTATTIINEAGEETGRWGPPSSDQDIRSSLMRANQFAHASVMFRRSVFDGVGGYSDMPFAQDYDLWLRMAGAGKVANLQKAFLYRRETSDQFGTGRETQQIRWAVRARLNAMKRGDYSPLAARHIVQPAIASMMPGPFRELIRRIGGQKAA